MGILEVLGNIGGVQQVLLVIFTFLVAQFNELSFDISTINFFYKVKTEDTSLNCQENNLEISFYNKLKILTSIRPNKKMRRLIKKGKKRL